MKEKQTCRVSECCMVWELLSLSIESLVGDACRALCGGWTGVCSLETGGVSLWETGVCSLDGTDDTGVGCLESIGGAGVDCLDCLDEAGAVTRNEEMDLVDQSG